MEYEGNILDGQPRAQAIFRDIDISSYIGPYEMSCMECNAHIIGEGIIATGIKHERRDGNYEYPDAGDLLKNRYVKCHNCGWSTKRGFRTNYANR